MRVFIAEKPSLGKAIAAILPGPQKRHKTHIESGEANVVVWCAGHILTQYLPEDYDPKYKKWQLDHLPMIPEDWRLKIAPRTRDLYQTIKQFVPKATLVIHAGDPDREGQLLVDQVLEHIGVNVPVKRLLISDMNAQAVRRAMQKLEDNDRYQGLRDAALGRARADWLYGLNMTRLYTLQGRKAGHDGILSVGRVQTPVLGLVVRRDREIESFESKLYFTLVAAIEAADGQFVAKWVPGGEAANYQDPEGRVIDQTFTQAIARELTLSQGIVLAYQSREKAEPPPLPFNLPELQKEAARHRRLSPRKTLDVAQSLYEKHKVLTYPRSDCQYLPTEHWSDAAQVRDAIAHSIGEGHALAKMTDQVDLILRGRCWNDGKVTAHHAIIPTTRWVPLDKLTSDEQWVYETVAHRYLLQFSKPHRYEQTEVTVSLEKQSGGNETFKARSRRDIEPGWRAWQAVLRSSSTGKPNENGQMDESVNASLPPLKKGDAVKGLRCDVVEKQTTPPKRFTEATLLDAMTGIARFVQDPAIKQILKETDGLGTPATQAGIIDLLFKRDYMEKQRKSVVSTTLGRNLIDTLPEPVTLPDMTALWEQNLASIAQGQAELPAFIDDIIVNVRALTETGKSQGPMKLDAGSRPTAPPKKDQSPTYACTAQGCEGRLRWIKGKKGFFWGCTNYGSGCKETLPDSRGKPAKTRSPKQKKSSAKKIGVKAGDNCPDCKKGKLRLRALKTGKNAGKPFLGCSTFPACRHFAWPEESKRQVAET